MRFYDTYEQKIHTWCFIILTGAIVWTFFFREWDNSSARAMQLAQFDHQMPADTEVVKIKALLVKLSRFYDLPVDSIADKIKMIHDRSYKNSMVNAFNINDCTKYSLHVNSLELLQVVDKLDDKKIPGGGWDMLSKRIQFAILVLNLRDEKDNILLSK